MRIHTRPGTIEAALATTEVAKRNGQDSVLCFVLGFEMAVPTEKCSVFSRGVSFQRDN